jgi:hypothetical protein
MNKELETALNQIRQIIPKVSLDDGKEYETIDLYDYQEGLWIAKISTTIDKKLINNSNHFINHIIKTNDWGQEDGHYPPYKRKEHKIYTRIINNYYNIINSKIEPTIIEDKCIFLHNSFSSGNAGHDLFCILNTLMKYKDVPSIKFVLFDEIFTNNNCHIIKLFINDDKLIKIKSGQIYNFKKQIFNFEKDNHHPQNYTNIINELLKKLNNHINRLFTQDELKLLQNKKVIIIKNSYNNYVVRKDDCINAELLFNYLKTDNNWYVCNPEKDNFFKMVYILQNASLIITGQNGISCCNQIFYNLNAEIIISVHNTGYKIKHTFLDDNIRFVNIHTFRPHPCPLDKMCNSYYYNFVKNAIIFPLEIKEDNVEQFKNLFK